MNSEGRILSMNDAQKDAIRSLAKNTLFANKTSEQIKDIMGIVSISALEAIAGCRAAEDVREHFDIAVEIMHTVDFWLQDLVAFELNQEYGPTEDEKNGLD